MSPAKRRSRGIVLSNQGKVRLEGAIANAQRTIYNGKPLTQQKLKQHITKAYSNKKSLDIKTIKKIRDSKVGTDKASVDIFFGAFGLTLKKSDYHQFEATPRQQTHEDLIAAPDIIDFYGRNDELTILETWVIQQHCKLVALLGMGGIGKTAIAAQLVNRIRQQFDYVIWRSLRETPPIDKILSDCIQFCSNQQEQSISNSIGDSINKLIYYLEQHRCLLIFDNVESILAIKKQTGYYYRDGYEQYGQLFQRIGEAKHQSCLLLTSREKSKEIAQLEGTSRPVRSFVIQGLKATSGQKILAAEGLSTSNPQWKKVFDHYAGHPFALKMAAKNIKDIFGSDIDRFLKTGKKTFNDIQDLLEQQFERLSEESQSVMFWLAINREPMTVSNIQNDILAVTVTPINDILLSLLRCFLVERTEVGFTLQNVVMEYVTDRLIKQIIWEIEHQDINYLNSHALVKAVSKEYIYKNQCRLILTPIQQHVINLDKKLLTLLSQAHSQPELGSTYAPGNILNLLCYSQKIINNLDFSNLTIRQAYLRNNSLHGVSFKNAQFINTEFAHTFGVALSVAFSPDSNYLAMAGMARDGNASISIFQVQSKQLIRTLRGHTSWLTRAITFSPDGTMLASGGEDSQVCLWDLESGQCLAIFEGHNYPVWSVDFHPDGHILASGGADGSIRLWDLTSYTCLTTLQVHPNRAWAIAFNPTGTMLASGSEDGTICVWSLCPLQNPPILFKEKEPGRVFSTAFNPDSTILATGSEDGTIRLWNIPNFVCSAILKGCTTWVWSLAFSPDGKKLASSSEDGSLYLWDISNHKQQEILEDFKRQREHQSRIWSIAISADGKKLASSGDDHTVGLWNITTFERIHTFKTHPTGIMSVAVSTNGRLIASGEAGSLVRLWDIASGRCFRELKGHENRIWSVAFSPKNDIIASGSEDSTVCFWDLKTGRCISTLKDHYGPVWSSTFSADGTLFASGGVDRIVRLWNTTTPHNPQLLNTFEHHQDWVWAVAFNPDGTCLVSAGADGTLQLWDLNQGEWITTVWSHQGVIRAACFSTHGNMIASGSDDGHVRLWDAKTYHCLHVFPSCESRIRALAFSADDTMLVSSSEDGTTHVWNLTSFEYLHVYHEHEGPIFDIAFCSGQQRFISGSGDGTVKLWSMDSDTSIATFRSPRLYEGTNITNTTGLTAAQKESLLVLGAIDETVEALIGRSAGT